MSNKIDWRGEKVKASTTVIKYVHWLFHMGLYDTLDCILLNLDMKASTLILISFLRFTVALYKDRPSLIPSWITARDRIKEELDHRDSDVNKLMSGLLEL